MAVHVCPLLNVNVKPRSSSILFKQLCNHLLHNKSWLIKTQDYWLFYTELVILSVTLWTNWDSWLNTIMDQEQLIIQTGLATGEASLYQFWDLVQNVVLLQQTVHRWFNSPHHLAVQWILSTHQASTTEFYNNNKHSWCKLSVMETAIMVETPNQHLSD